jgi:NADP-dependent 3-hydroxy acid dehydrogenase YdfG
MTALLAGRVALVTGASAGIGEAAALALAAAGATVAVVARREDRLKALVQKIEAADGKAIALPGDVASEAVAKGAVAEALQRLGRLDILVNSAGLIQSGNVENSDTAHWRQLLEVNLLASLYTSQAAITAMRAQGGGDIINISSTAGRRASGAFPAYSASKFGLTAMNEAMRQEVGRYGIRVCIIEPGATATEVAEGIADPAVRSAMRQHISKDGALLPQDVAAAIIFVLSLPPRANISQLMIRPTIDGTPT